MKNNKEFDAREVIAALTKIINELESPSGMWQTQMDKSVQSSSDKLARAAAGMMKKRSGKLFDAIRHSGRTTREYGNFNVILNDDRIMDSLLPGTVNRYTGVAYPSYWRLLLEGWGNRGKGRPLYRNLAIIYDYADGSIQYTSPFDPAALNPENSQRVTFSRHPGSAARDWLSLMSEPLTRETEEFADKTMQEIFDRHLGR